MYQLPPVTIENVVVSASLGRELDLEALAADLPGTTYDPSRFPGLVYRNADPEVVVLLFGSGKVVVTGAGARSDPDRAVGAVGGGLREAGLL